MPVHEPPAAETMNDSPPDSSAPKLRSAPPADPGTARRPSVLAKQAARLAATKSGRGLAAARAAWWRFLARGKLAKAARPLRLCLGAGGAPIPGWVNVDFEPTSDVRLDLRFPLPAADASVALIASEHVIEHLALEDGLALMRECRRVLADDGVLRVATPDLAELVRAYQGDWRAQDWVNWPGHEWIDSAARMLNVSFRSWGHLHLYDETELTRRLREAGFASTRRCALGESQTPGLAGLETRADSLLVVEAWGRS